MSTETKLPDYAGSPVANTTISIRNAGDGLSKGMAIDPQVLVIGGTYYVTLECTLDAHDYKRMASAPNMLTLDQVLKAGVAVLMDADLVKAAIEEQRERLLVAEEAKKGIERLPYDDEGELGLAHARGDHASGLVEGCPVCQSEKDAEAAENAPTQLAGRRKRTPKS
jgi:hypothetical protein